MAGFSWSAFLTLYLTAIAFPQGAGLSLETKASRGGKMPDSTSGPVIMSQPSRNISLLNGKSRDSLQNNTDKGCPNCNNNEDEESDLYKVRIEMIKAKLLAKLQLDKEPVLKQKPKELRIAALLSNLNLIGEENNHKEPDDSEDEYYGKTTQIIVFSEKAKLPPSQNDQHSSGRLRFHFKLEQNSLPSSVPSALLWLHMRKGKNKELEGRYLHIEALGRRTVRGNTEVQDIKVVRSQVKKEKKSGSGWIVVDVKDIVQHWFSRAAPAHFNDTHKPIYGLDISCRDCETKTSHLISSRGPLRPFLVIDLDKPKALSRKKRQPLDCVGNQPQQECCRRMLYVNFKKIGWDWIIFPEGFHANFCDGTCAGIVDPFYSYPYLLQEVSRANKQERVSICCTPTKMSAISVLHFNNDERVMKIDVPDMRVDACGCF